MFRHTDVVCLCLVCILWQFSMLRSYFFAGWSCMYDGNIKATYKNRYLNYDIQVKCALINKKIK